ncbi:MAG: Signal transduction histidine-protein kinase BaeS [Syntrophorhabdaceae bacterium PtaU1.Bin034]|nr:MAG: Signal transduction histidine-protein kinase BaeS [Syntrophorhabdaceae bacterium PtaU1.Bin034]
MACRKVDLDPAELLRQSIELFRAEFQEKGVALTVDIPQGSHLRLSADPERLHQLFANLLDNSLKYTESGGNLVVRLDGSGRGSITVDFQDSAPGVPEKELGRLFERLYRLEASRSRTTGGAGLGLAICKGIVEAHGGTIEALASPLGGVWIRVIIPTKEG